MNETYRQQYQLHRFVTQFWRQPVAVNDLGWMSHGPAPGCGYAVISMDGGHEGPTISPKVASGKPDISRALTDEDLNLVSHAVLDACDAEDGLKDRHIESPCEGIISVACGSIFAGPPMEERHCVAGPCGTPIARDIVNQLRLPAELCHRTGHWEPVFYF